MPRVVRDPRVIPLQTRPAGRIILPWFRRSVECGLNSQRSGHRLLCPLVPQIRFFREESSPAVPGDAPARLERETSFPQMAEITKAALSLLWGNKWRDRLSIRLMWRSDDKGEFYTYSPSSSVPGSGENENDRSGPPFSESSPEFSLHWS